MKRAGGISRRNKAGKYFTVKTIDSNKNSLGFSLKYELKLDKIKDDERLDGTFVIQTNEEKYENEKLIEIYKNLNKVENAFSYYSARFGYKTNVPLERRTWGMYMFV